MLTDHVTKKLAAFHDGELPPAEASRVAEHLLRCERCRAEHDEIRLGAAFAERLTLVEAPDDLWPEIEHAVAAARSGEAAAPRRLWSRLPVRLAAAAAVIAAFAVTALWLTMQTGPAWRVSTLYGTPRVDSDRVGEEGQIHVGETLETDAGSRAEIRVGAIGYVDVEPNSRVRLLNASIGEHRLALDQGTLHARIWAPPRIFFVDTPSGVAVDYGCTYTLAVDEAGASLLHVTSGWVAMELNGRSSLVPSDALCATRPGVGPGTPYFDDSPDALRAALTRYDFESGGDAALDVVLANARERDSLTLWYLLERAPHGQRERIYDRLAALVAPPEGVDRARVLAGDSEALDRWRDALEVTW